MTIPHLFIFKFVMNVFNVMLWGRIHYINNTSSILLFNILYAFAFIKIMYYECWNKPFKLNWIYSFLDTELDLTTLNNLENKLKIFEYQVTIAADQLIVDPPCLTDVLPLPMSVSRGKVFIFHQICVAVFATVWRMLLILRVWIPLHSLDIVQLPIEFLL